MEINRISGVDLYKTPQVNSKSSNENDATFNVDYSDNGVIYENQKKEDKKAQKEAEPGVEEKEGVKLNIARKEQVVFTKAKPEIIDESFSESAKRVIHQIITGIKQFFKSIWEGEAADPTKEVIEVDTVDFQDMKGKTIEEILNSKLPKEEKINTLLEKDERGKLLINTELLTFYDKKGRITSINASDKERILKGDYKTLKL